MDEKSKINFLDALIVLSAICSSFDAFVNRLKQDEQEIIKTDEKKAKFLHELIKYSNTFKSLDGFVSALESIKQDVTERYEKETCRAKTTEVLASMNAVQSGADVHTFNKARMYLGIEHKKGLEESYLAYLTQNAIATQDYSRLKKHMRNMW